MLGKHLEKEHVGLLYSCNFCQKELLFPEILEDHMQKLHKPSGFAITSCHDCNMLSGTLEPLMKHMAFSHVSDLFSCNGCDGDAFDKRSLQKHLRANHGAVVVGHEGALEVGRGGNPAGPTWRDQSGGANLAALTPPWSEKWEKNLIPLRLELVMAWPPGPWAGVEG